MRALSETLLAAQQAAPFAEPKVRVRLKNRRAGVAIPSWTRIYTGAEPAGPHDAYSGLSTGLFQIRSNPADDKLYTRYIPDPHALEGASRGGYATAGSEEAGQLANRKVVSKYTFPDDLTVHTIYAYIRAAAADKKAKAVIYSDNAGVPGALLATSDEQTTVPTADAWVTFTFSTPYPVTHDTAYWIGVICDGTLYHHRDAGTGDTWTYLTDTYSDGPSDPFGTPLGYGAYNGSYYTNGDPPLGWTDTGKTAHAVAVSGTGLNAVAAYIDNASPYHVWYAVSADGGATFGAWTDSGMVSDATGSVAVAVKDASNYVLLYTRGAQVYARELDAGGWLAEVAATYTFTSISGLSGKYAIDYNFLLTGEDATNRPGLWQAIFGDGFNQPAHTFSGVAAINIEPATTAYAYSAPHLDRADTYRATVVQHYAATTDQYNQLVTNVSQLGDFVTHSWREPYPVPYQNIYGLALAHTSLYMYQTTADGIWESEYTVAWVDISNDVLEVIHQEYPIGPRSNVKITVDNTGGKYNAFAYLGYEVNIEWGYVTAIGVEYSQAAVFWVSGWKFVSPPWFPLRSFWPVGIIGTLEIAAQGMWDMLARYKTPRALDWSDDTHTPFQMLSYLFARVGFEFVCTTPYDSNITNHIPFEVPAGQSGLTAIKRLLSYLNGFVQTWGSTPVFRSAEATDESVYSYYNLYFSGHLLFRGNYQFLSKDPNQVQVWGDGLMEEHYDTEQIERTEARLTRVTAPDYVHATTADLRATGELRKGVWKKTGGGWVQTTVNCGIEVGDVVTITDTTAGMNANDFRVLGIETRYRKLYWIFMQNLQLGGI